jgi:hypothetical protein
MSKISGKTKEGLDKEAITIEEQIKKDKKIWFENKHNKDVNFLKRIAFSKDPLWINIILVLSLLLCIGSTTFMCIEVIIYLLKK